MECESRAVTLQGLGGTSVIAVVFVVKQAIISTSVIDVNNW